VGEFWEKLPKTYKSILKLSSQQHSHVVVFSIKAVVNSGNGNILKSKNGSKTKARHRILSIF
jgi:hypothetical protein